MLKLYNMTFPTTPKPDTLIQIVHINGPRKGQVDEISKDSVSMGRDPNCDIVFPPGLRIVSRRHAEITREGDHFILTNQGRNGSFVNGTLVESIHLKQGDIIALANGGPQVSFLSKHTSETILSTS